MPLLRDIQLKEEFRGELLREIFSIQEEERRRIARELHDETSQDLASLSANLEAALGMLPDGADMIRARLKDAQAISIGILEEIHKLIYELRPTLLDDLGLGPAVRWLAEVNLGTAGIKIDFKVMGKERRLPHQLEITPFRITKEAFSNITRHAHATKVSLVLHCKKIPLQSIFRTTAGVLMLRRR